MGPELIYALITVVPALILIFMVVFGLEHDVDTDLGGDMGADVPHDIGAGDVSEIGGPSFFGVKLIFSFLIGFGLAGFLTVFFKWRFPHLLSGLIGGALVYAVVYRMLKFLYQQQANTLWSSSSVVGLRGLVTSAILKGGTGEIKAEDPGTGRSLYLRARAVDPEKEYRAGSEVTIRNVISGLAKVE